jgi:hypothetical protein
MGTRLLLLVVFQLLPRRRRMVFNNKPVTSCGLQSVSGSLEKFSKHTISFDPDKILLLEPFERKGKIKITQSHIARKWLNQN